MSEKPPDPQRRPTESSRLKEVQALIAEATLIDGRKNLIRGTILATITALALILSAAIIRSCDSSSKQEVPPRAAER